MYAAAISAALLLTVMPFPSRAQTPPPPPQASLVTALSLDKIANAVATTLSGRVFVGFPHLDSGPGLKAVEADKNGNLHPYPDAAWNEWAPGTDATNAFVRVPCVLAQTVNCGSSMWAPPVSTGPLFRETRRSFKSILKQTGFPGSIPWLQLRPPKATSTTSGFMDAEDISRTRARLASLCWTSIRVRPAVLSIMTGPPPTNSRRRPRATLWSGRTARRSVSTLTAGSLARRPIPLLSALFRSALSHRDALAR